MTVFPPCFVMTDRSTRPALLTKGATLVLQILARWPLLLVEQLETKKSGFARKKIQSQRIGQCGLNKRKCPTSPSFTERATFREFLFIPSEAAPQTGEV
jgi:hypothetical protein